MALHNLARVASATVGTGTLTLGATISGFLTFANAGVQDGEKVTYSIRDGANSEIGQGTYTAAGTTLSRDVVYRSTNGGAKINCSGNEEVFITAAAEDFGLPKGFITIGTIANNAIDPNNDIDLQARRCRDSTDSVDISVAALTKRLDANWTVGNNGGFLDTGTKTTNTWYHIYAIRRSDTGITDYICSTNTTSPALPAGYDSYAKLRGQSFRTDGTGSGNILPFQDNGDQIWWSTSEVIDLSGGNATTPTLVTLSVPPGEKLEVILAPLLVAPSGGATVHIYDADISGTPVIKAFRTNLQSIIGWRITAMTNLSAQVKYYLSIGTASCSIYTQGWKYGLLQR